MDEDKATCSRCDYSYYSFSTIDDCRECEEHGICVGTMALVPEEEYWHSTPFSPRMIKCPIDEACKRENRTRDLVDYYEDTTRVSEELRTWNQSHRKPEDFTEDYPQCSDAYNGTLCSSCAEEHGRSVSGHCEPCRGSRLVSVLMTLASAVVFFFAFSFKLWLAWRSMHTDLAIQASQRLRIALGLDKSSLSSMSSSEAEDALPEGLAQYPADHPELVGDIQSIDEKAAGPSTSEQRAQDLRLLSRSNPETDQHGCRECSDGSNCPDFSSAVGSVSTIYGVRKSTVKGALLMSFCSPR